MAGLLACLLLAIAAQPASAQDRFRIRIDLNEEATARLQEDGRWISIRAGYYGEVVPGAETDWGRTFLGSETFEVFPVSQVVEFGGSLAAMPVDWVEEPRVGILVSTVGAPERPELLLCDYVESTLAGFVRDGETVIECMTSED